MTLRHDISGRGRPVVLLHGIPGSAGIWHPVRDRLQTEHRVVVPDLVGFGPAAGHPDLSALRAPAQADALARLLDELGIRDAVLVGHDFGGPVALQVLEQRPDLVAGLVLLATNAFPDTPIPFPLSTVTWPVIGPLLARVAFSRPSLRVMTRMMTGTPRVALDRGVYVGDREQGRSIRLIFTDALAHLAERYASFPATMAATRVPVAVVWGDRDPFFPVDQARRTAEAFPDATLSVLEGAGHALPEERPDEVADVAAAVAATAAVR